MGDRVRRPGLNSWCMKSVSVITSHQGQLSLAIPQWVGTTNTSQNGGDALWLESNGKYGSCLYGK